MTVWFTFIILMLTALLVYRIHHGYRHLALASARGEMAERTMQLVWLLFRLLMLGFCLLYLILHYKETGLWLGLIIMSAIALLTGFLFRAGWRLCGKELRRTKEERDNEFVEKSFLFIPVMGMMCVLSVWSAIDFFGEITGKW